VASTVFFGLVSPVCPATARTRPFTAKFWIGLEHTFSRHFGHEYCSASEQEIIYLYPSKRTYWRKGKLLEDTINVGRRGVNIVVRIHVEVPFKSR
jgi:hypothetical protein